MNPETAATFSLLSARAVRMRAQRMLALGLEDRLPNLRVDFQPVVDTPFGPTKIEVRVMYIWGDRLRAVNTIIRDRKSVV